MVALEFALKPEYTNKKTMKKLAVRVQERTAGFKQNSKQANYNQDELHENI